MVDAAYTDLYVETQHATIRIMRIPQEELLSFGFRRPHAFLRHVLFAVCGTEGHLFIDSVDSQPIQVDYNSIDIREKYIYISDPATEHAFIDIDGLNDRVTYSRPSPRRAKLRRDIVERDGCCVISHYGPELAEAVHIIPHSKGGEYIWRIVELRSDAYNEDDPPNESDCIENAFLLRPDLHTAFGRGSFAFIKVSPSEFRVPNFSMTCEDIPYVANGSPPPIPPPEKRICVININKISDVRLQWITTGWNLTFSGNDDLPPPSLMLIDFHFGISCYRRWGVNDEFLRQYHEDHYKHIPVFSSVSVDSEDNSENSEADSADDPNDPTYSPL
ncbi:hypothetical protein H0H93_007395 [Arthromyces matolae]|nr:hypothetical protein H0H93_007395 [Arthromyces matolae]